MAADEPSPEYVAQKAAHAVTLHLVYGTGSVACRCLPVIVVDGNYGDGDPEPWLRHNVNLARVLVSEGGHP